MPKYLAVTRQNGGCDYTIGCGINVELFDAESLANAKVKMIIGLDGDTDETVESIKSITIHEVIGEPVKIYPSDWEPARRARMQAAKQAEADKRDQAEYDRLKKKFEG